MLTGNNTSAEYCKPNVSRYQPSFDLRKNIARVIAHYSMEAIGKGIMLDIYVDHEIPNYFHGYVNCFVEIFSKMLKICIASMDEGEITIRIQQESVHQTNNCKTALSVSMTTTDYNFSQETFMQLSCRKSHFASTG